MKSYADLAATLQNALRLSEGMTYKFAVPGMPYMFALTPTPAAWGLQRLKERDILHVPDYVVNVGGAMASLGMELQGKTREEVEKEVVESDKCALKKVFEIEEADAITTDAAARRIAQERLDAGI